MRRNLILVILGLAALAGCGSPPPKGIELLVDTVPPGASCVLSHGGTPIATVEPTPAIAIVPIDPTPVLVQCRRPGFADASAVAPVRGVGPGWTYAVTYHPASDYQASVTVAMTPQVAGLPR